MFAENVRFFQKAVVFHPTDDTFLTLKRAEGDPTGPGYWDLPGGKVDFGETHRDSIEREILEESGLLVEGLDLLEVVTRFKPETGIYTIFIGHRCRAQSDAISLSEEHSTHRWVSPTEFQTLQTWTMFKRLVQAL